MGCFFYIVGQWAPIRPIALQAIVTTLDWALEFGGEILLLKTLHP